MIELIPAIDIIGGQCVRLTKGDYDQKTVYRDSPAEVAKEFEEIGFKRLHVVDLDGAKSKHIVNEQVLKDVRKMMDMLPPTQREVVFMRFYQEMSFKEIAEATGVSINTSLGRMRYAILNLRRMAKQHSMALQLD